MKQNQKGIAHIALSLIVLVAAAIGFAGWKIYDNHKSKSVSTTKSSPTTTASSTPTNFDECVAVKAGGLPDGATLDKSAKTLTCLYGQHNKKFTHPALETIKTISASFSRPTWGELPTVVKQYALNKFSNKDCSGNTVTVNSTTDSAVDTMMAGGYISVAVGCDGATGFAFKQTLGVWKLDKHDYSKCQVVEDEQIPIEMLKHSFDPNVNARPTCVDSKYIEHLVITE